MALPAVEGSSLPEGVCGKDERVQVDPMTSPPYKWICFLTIHRSKVDSGGTGFKIHLPDVGRTAIVTAGHVTYSRKDKEFANSITVKFPGEDPIKVGTKNLYAAPEFIDSGNADYDYGLILLPGAGKSDDGFGWSAIVPDGELNNRLVTNCGYPGDKPQGTMWITGGEISSYTANRFSYMNDTYGGQSGSPVYTWYGGYWTVLGVHTGTLGEGQCPNRAVRFTILMIYRFLEFMNCLKIKSVRSVKFPDVYLRCDGRGVTSYSASGGGTVNCQYKPPRAYEKFYIYPVEMPPSLVLDSGTYKVAIQSTAFNNVFIRLNSKGMSQPESSGGGEVNCQYTARTSERYFLEQVSKSPLIVAFRSVQFPHCYIRLDGRGVDSPSVGGGGTVNCQYYPDPSSSPPSKDAWERFYME
ncbi:hypothetical protein ACROYT_G009758 [Oculina patagonica]